METVSPEIDSGELSIDIAWNKMWLLRFFTSHRIRKKYISLKFIWKKQYKSSITKNHKIINFFIVFPKKAT